MRFVPVNRLEPSMIVARPIYGSDGRILLNSGVELVDSYIGRLKQLGIPGVYIQDEYIGEIEYHDVVSEKTRTRAFSGVKETFESILVGKGFDVEVINESVRDIIDDIASNPNVLINLTDIRAYDAYTFGHSVNVCVLSVLLGFKMGLNELEIRELGIGSILHDIGKIFVPEDIIKKPGPLTDQEMQEMKKHSLIGWEILREHPEIPVKSARVAYQHHERPNGTGYPHGLSLDKISTYARIVAVADAYDAMTSERLYQEAIMPFEAIQIIDRLGGVQFDPEVANLLCESVAPYPVGCQVRLSDNQIGMVVDVNQADRFRPVIRVIYNPDGTQIDGFREIDLAKESILSIVEVIK